MADNGAIQPDASWHKPNIVRSLDDAGGEPIEIVLEEAEELAEQMGEDADGVVARNPDGSVTVSLGDGKPPGEDADDGEFDENLVDKIDQTSLSAWAEELLEGIEADERSREEWMSTREKGLKLLGLTLENPRSDPGGSDGAPLEGMSTVRDPALTEAVVRGQANAIGEFLPASGPAKIEDVGDDAQDDLAETLEKDFNYYLTTTASEYYPDTRRLLAWLYFGGFGVKKVYRCPMRRRPVAESVNPQHFLVSNNATDLQNADRVTHIITMRQSMFKRMVRKGIYRQIAIPPPVEQKDRVTAMEERIEGVQTDQTRPEDQPHTLYEVCCEKDLAQFTPKQFEDSGVALPYLVTIEKDSRQIVSVRRHWKPDDEECMRRKMYVTFCFITWIGFYGLGLLHLMGNLTSALTAMLREAIDNGMMANFPGGLMSKSFAARQESNNLAAGPGEWKQVDLTGVDDIRKVMMPFNYRDVTPGFLQVMENTRQYAAKIGGTADLPIGEGKQDAPVGTTLALIEQATKVESAVHKGLHTSQAEEFELLLDLFREDPEAFWRHQKQTKARRQMTSTWDRDKLLRALDDYDLVPKADPNVPSHLHRIMKAVARIQLAQGAPPGVFNLVAVYKEALRVLGDTQPEKYLAPPNPNPPQPGPQDIAAMAKMQANQVQQNKIEADTAKAAADRASKEKIADSQLARELVIHARDSASAAGQQGFENSMALRDHALDATKAAHDAAMDVHAASQPPEGSALQ